jgi:hypothetical protein
MLIPIQIIFLSEPNTVIQALTTTGNLPETYAIASDVAAPAG